MIKSNLHVVIHDVDYVLFCFHSADGRYELTLWTKATLHPDGLVIWEPPAIYKSSCLIDVQYFPFDQQSCHMTFGSWTYNGFQVDLVHYEAENSTTKQIGIDLTEFYPNVEWDVLDVPARRNEKRHLLAPYPDITYNIKMRRKALFYTVNLVIPCVSLSFLTILVFYLPSDSSEKITLCISILLSLTVFFLLLSEMIPPTSQVVPLIAKYLLFTMILVTLSICVTVYVLNVHFRTPATHNMSPLVRKMFLHILPRLLLMRRPQFEKDKTPRLLVSNCTRLEAQDAGKNGAQAFSTFNEANLNERRNRMSGIRYSPPYCNEISRALAGVQYIAEHLRQEEEERGVSICYVCVVK